MASTTGLQLTPRSAQQTLVALRRRIALFQWLAPLLMVLLVLVYEAFPGHWIHSRFGSSYHILTEILVFGTLGPILTFLLIFFLRRWLEERETSDLQAELLESAQGQIKVSQAATDDALQAMFAASVFLATLESKKEVCTEEEANVIHQTQQVIDISIQKLRNYLEAKFF